MGTIIFLLIVAIAIWRFVSSKRLATLLQESDVTTTYHTVNNDEYSQNRDVVQNQKAGNQAHQPIPKVGKKEKKYVSTLNVQELEKVNDIVTDFDPAKAVIYSEIMRPKYF